MMMNNQFKAMMNNQFKAQSKLEILPEIHVVIF